MNIDVMVFKIGIAVSVGLAFVTNLILYVAFCSQKVAVDFMRSIRPGYLENLYRQTPAIHSPRLSGLG